MARKQRWEDEEEEAAPPLLFCWLCERQMGETVEWHHPLPKSRGGKERVAVHPICHRTIHAQFTNSQLAKDFGSPEAMRTNTEIAKFLDWIADKDPDFHAPTRSKSR